jgi:hypothetical protein
MYGFGFFNGLLITGYTARPILGAMTRDLNASEASNGVALGRKVYHPLGFFLLGFPRHFTWILFSGVMRMASMAEDDGV